MLLYIKTLKNILEFSTSLHNPPEVLIPQRQPGYKKELAIPGAASANKIVPTTLQAKLLGKNWKYEGKRKERKRRKKTII